MTKRQIKYRNELLRKIHLNTGYKTLKDSDDWSRFLQEHYGEKSSRELGIDELKNLIAVLEGSSKSYTNLRSRELVKRYLRDREYGAKGLCSEAQIKSILKYQEKLNLNNRELLTFIDRQIGRMPIKLELIKKDEATKIITGFMQWAKRR